MFQLFSRVVTTSAGFIYPTYASFKAVKSNDLSKLETWLMYWAIMGVIMALESTVEWLFTWIPFYYEFKTLAILWLTLPQIQGSTYLYVAHLHPFLLEHETDIDAALADAKVRAKQVGLEWLNKAVQRIRQAVIGTLAPQLMGGAPSADAANGNADPDNRNLADSTSLYNMGGNFLRTYGPAAVAAGSALLHPMNGRQPSVRNSGLIPTGPRPRIESFLESPKSSSATATASGRSISMTSIQARMRRAELEAQLAELDAGSFASPIGGAASGSGSSSPVYNPPYSNTKGRRSSAGGPGVHPRSVSAGQYPSSLSASGPSSQKPLDRSRTPSATSLALNADYASSSVPRDPVAARIDRSFLQYGFEEIRRDEVGDYPPVKAEAMQAGVISPGGTRRQNWWFWSGEKPPHAANGKEGESLLGSAKKNA